MFPAGVSGLEDGFLKLDIWRRRAVGVENERWISTGGDRCWAEMSNGKPQKRVPSTPRGGADTDGPFLSHQAHTGMPLKASASCNQLYLVPDATCTPSSRVPDHRPRSASECVTMNRVILIEYQRNPLISVVTGQASVPRLFFSRAGHPQRLQIRTSNSVPPFARWAHSARAHALQ